MFKFHKNNRKGTRIQDGKKAHATDHHNWSRRQFLSHSGMMAAGSALLGSSPSLAWTSPFLADLYQQDDYNDNDRVLILIRLNGGNDGLNTIIPYYDVTGVERRLDYENYRPNLRIGVNYPPSGGLSIDLENVLDPLTIGDPAGDFALRKFKDEYGEIDETGLIDMWNDEKMAVIHNVGYPNHVTSHFKGSDLWAAGADSNLADTRKYSGWMGRYFNETLPAFLDTPPKVPPAIQIGKTNNLMFRGRMGAPHDLVFSDLVAFEDLITNGSLYNNQLFNGSCIRDIERSFVRQVGNSAYRYADTVIAAWKHPDAKHAVDISYELPGLPDNDGFLESMATVVKLIKGHLKTKIYLINLTLFDTHSSQEPHHGNLMKKVSKAVRSAYLDLAASGDADRVMMMTMSEFGREIGENSNGGTDHGTLAPLMLFGGGVNGKNMYGTPIDLSAVDTDGKVDFETQEGAIDYRTVYERVLRDWLCADPLIVNNVINDDIANDNILPHVPCNTTTAGSSACIDPLGGMIKGGCNATVSESSNYETYVASQVLFGYNIFKEEGIIKVKFKYATKAPGNIQLQILNEDRTAIVYGVEEEEEGVIVIKDVTLGILFNEYHQANSYTHVFTAEDILMPGISYICQLAVNGMIVEKVLEIH